MTTCPPNLVYSFLTVCEIIIFKVDKKVSFFPMPKGDSRVWRPKKQIFQVGMDYATFYSCL